MRPVPANRCLLYTLIVALGLAADLASKHLVFADLGYPADQIRPVVAGRHELFDHPPFVHGQSRLYLRGPVTFRLYTGFNRGALWGMFAGWTAVFVGISLFTLTAILYGLFVRGAAESRLLTIGLALISAGALGNLWDRLALHGCTDASGPIHGVRDFLLWSFFGWDWPLFNAADLFLVIGAGCSGFAWLRLTGHSADTG